MNITFIVFCVVMIVLLLSFVWSIWFRKNTSSYISRTKSYRLPDQEDVHKKMRMNPASPLDKEKDIYIPKVVYMTYHDLDGIPDYVIDNIKKYCSGYTIEIYGDQMCEDFLYEYFGPDAMQLFRELKVGAHKADFWRYCILYVKGGYYFDIKTDFKKHIDDIFKGNTDKIWYTVLSKVKSSIYNGIIVTPQDNPILWDAILGIYNFGNISNNYHYNTTLLYNLIQNSCSEKLHVGMNIQNNRWKCELFQEICHIGNDKYGLLCSIENYAKNTLFNTRYIDFPWTISKVLTPNSIMLLQIDHSSKVTTQLTKPIIAVISSYPYHFECLGFLLDITKDKYDLHFYGVPDIEGYVDFFHKKYNFKNFLSNYSNLNESLYTHIIKLTSDDPYIVVDQSKLINIQHYSDFKNLQSSAITITLSPLVMNPLSQTKLILRKSTIVHNITPVYEGDNLTQRKEQIIMIGEWNDGPLQVILNTFRYKVILIRRKPRYNDKKWCKYFNIECIYSPSTEKMIDIVKFSKFIFIHKKDDCFSGAIALALSFHVPMIIDKPQASIYDFPCFTYDNSVAELAHLNNISNQEYISFLNILSQYVKDKREFNRRNINTIFAKSIPFIQRPIPRLIHQTVADKTTIGPDIAKTIENLKDMHPQWTHMLYDDKEVKEFIRINYPHLLDTFLKINPDYGPSRADFFRYLVMYKLGGVYLDCKSSVDRPLDDILNKSDTFVYQVSSWEGGQEFKVKDIHYFDNHEINQWFIVSSPENPILKAVIDQVVANINDPRMSNERGKLGVLRITGPIMYTNTIAPLLEIYPSRRILPNSINEGGFIYRGTLTEKESRDYSSKPHYSKFKTPVILS
jgi:inositol phosphorylceramide mannosyltransferase catalytic subunit